jgi:hypothetical protein
MYSLQKPFCLLACVNGLTCLCVVNVHISVAAEGGAQNATIHAQVKKRTPKTRLLCSYASPPAVLQQLQTDLHFEL